MQGLGYDLIPPNSSNELFTCWGKKQKSKFHFCGTIEKGMLGVNTRAYSWSSDLSIDPVLILICPPCLPYSLWNETIDIELEEWNKSFFS